VRGGNFYDAAGRLVNFRGVNVAGSSKLPPFIPWEPGDTSEWDYLRGLGFNFVRFLVIWEAIEPQKGVYDEVYLDKVKTLIKEAANRGFYVLVDMHQDLFSRCLKGDGAPGWAVQEAGVDPDNNDSFGGRYWSLAYLLSNDVRKCFTAFWTSRGKPDGLMEHYKNAFVKLARKLNDNPNVLGYDIMNEPWEGNICNLAGVFENFYLKPFYKYVINAIRTVDPGAIGFVEPNELDTFTSKLTPFGPGVGQLVYAPHMYDVVYEVLGTLLFDDLPLIQFFYQSQTARADVLGMPMLVGEFGALDLPPAGSMNLVVDNMCRTFESGFTSSCLWDYSHVGRVLGEVVRPYVRRLKGTPVSQTFDKSTKRYELQFCGGSMTIPTIIHVPQSIQYPGDFKVEVSDGNYSFNPGTGEISYTCRKRILPHKLVITPTR
jgi:endoglycosylceramidase